MEQVTIFIDELEVELDSNFYYLYDVTISAIAEVVEGTDVSHPDDPSQKIYPEIEFTDFDIQIGDRNGLNYKDSIRLIESDDYVYDLLLNEFIR